MIISTDCGLSSNSPPTGCRHRGPRRKSSCPQHSMMNRPQPVPTHAKQILNDAVHVQETLRVLVSRYREQTLNRYDQDRAPQEEHEIRDDPGHHLPDVGDPSHGVCRYDQRYRR